MDKSKQAQQKRVLVVDDDDQIAKMYSTHLEIKGFITKIVGNGEDALATTIEFKPDLILLDVMMPKIDGYQVLDILHNTDKTRHIPIFMLTALGEKKDRQKAAEAGAEEFFIKTEVDPETITKKIQERLSQT